MKKKIVFLLIVIILVVFSVVIILQNRTQKTSQMSIEKEENIPLEWHGNYIWNDTNDNNSWMCFRKKINVKQKDIPNAVAQIAADSKYYLYINGKLVVFDGGIKRGQKPNSIYYDEINLSKYLQKGENTIAVLAWYWGGESYSHISSGQAGMMFQMRLGNKYIISDETWKVQRHPAYLQDSLRPNNRLMEYNVWYDASLADENWYKTDYDDSNWENAKVLNIAESLPWGEMIKRSIPQFKVYKIKEYENMSEYKNYTTEDDEVLELSIPYNAQFTPYLKIDAPAGLKITIKTDMYEDVCGDSVKCTYITKEGEQEFEALPWMNGEKVYYEIPKGVKIISLKYRETGYDSKFTGKFESDDEFLNELWKKASRTLYVNMRDSYMDCPNRERAQWFGDMNSEMMEAMYALDTNAYALYEKGIKVILGWSEQDALLTVVPNSLEPMHLPMQALAGISGFYDYYEYTGNKEFLEEVYTYTKKYLDLWVQKENGLFTCTSQYYIWAWGDSAPYVDYDGLENAFYYLAMQNLCKIADVLGFEDDKILYESKLESLKLYYNEMFWTSNGYKNPTLKYYDERANALAVISGLADSEKYPIIKKLLVKEKESSTYMEKYVLEALCQMGYIEEAQDRIKDRYKEMVNGEEACSTLWEHWDYKVGTKNHAWAGGPLIIMSKYFAGVKPLESGYDKIEIKPQFGNLKEISSNTTTIKGDVSVDAKKSENEITLKINVPVETKVAIEKVSNNCQISINNKTVFENGEYKENKIAKFDSEDDEFVYFYVKSGEYEIESIDISDKNV